MEIIKQLTYIFTFSFIGQSVSKYFDISIPGSIIGLILFFICLKFKLVKIEKVENTSKFLMDNLGILFIPAGVAIMLNFHKIKDTWLILFVICLITTIISLIVVAKFTQYLIEKRDNDVRNN